MDDDIFKLMKQETPYLADDGFTAKVMENLPPVGRSRRRVILGSWLIAATLAAIFWGSGLSNAEILESGPVLYLSTGFFVSLGLLAVFAFIAFDEGVTEI